MKNSLILGASGGIGAALAETLRTTPDARSGTVTTLSRSRDGFDVTDESSVAATLGALKGPFDLVVLATGALVAGNSSQQPEKALNAMDPAAMLDLLAVNAVGPAVVLKHLMPLLPKRDRSVVAVLSARVGSIGDNRLGGWISYRTSKAALNQIVRTTAIELKRTHPGAICVSLHPGTVRTDLTRAYQSRHATVSPDAAAANLLSVIDGLSRSDSGGFFDWQGKPVAW